ncbi:glycosyltransferase [Sphingomonas caseinilyticus]
MIMPVYNRARQVTAAIQSVLDQQFDDFELIVVDDGSTDGTLEVLKAIEDRRLRVLTSPRNAGGNAARNRGIEASRAPLLAFLDSDDCYLPNKLGYLNDYFAAHPDVDVLLDSFIKRYRPERDRPDVNLRNPVLDSNDAILEALFTRRIWKATPGIAVRRDAALRAGKFDPSLRRRQDFDFILRLAAVARCATTDELLWIKTYSTDAISGQLDNFAGSTLSFLERHPEYRDNPAYRSGLAHDLGRHFVRLGKRRQWAQALRDAKLLSSTLGVVPLVRLTVEGAGLFRSRRRAIRGKASTG